MNIIKTISRLCPRNHGRIICFVCSKLIVGKHLILKHNNKWVHIHEGQCANTFFLKLRNI